MSYGTRKSTMSQAGAKSSRWERRKDAKDASRKMRRREDREIKGGRY
jgi:hypothetical protein